MIQTVAGNVAVLSHLCPLDVGGLPIDQRAVGRPSVDRRWAVGGDS